MEIILEKVEIDQKEVLFRLLQYSLFEESLNDQNEMNNEAIFEYEWFENYFIDTEREAYFIREKRTNKLLGFAMINTYVQRINSGHSIAEFMVIPKYRRNRVGKNAAIQCFEKHKGNWEISPSYGSEQAYQFWKNVVREYTDGNYHLDQDVFVFCRLEKPNRYI